MEIGYKRVNYILNLNGTNGHGNNKMIDKLKIQPKYRYKWLKFHLTITKYLTS